MKFNSFLVLGLIAAGCVPFGLNLGDNESIRIYIEFADGLDRGLYNSATRDKGIPDENYDATTSVVVNWHRLPETDPALNSRMEYRKVHPHKTKWRIGEGESFPFWQRDELINRVILNGLSANSIYEVIVKENGKIFRFRTMPERLHDRIVKIAVASDLQNSSWNYPAKENARMVALQKPDMFVVVGDLLSSNGDPHSEKESDQWARYLDMLYSSERGYFFYDLEIDNTLYSDIIIPHIMVVGNHDVGGQMMSPRDVNTTGIPRYPLFTGPNWPELLFHFPFGSEGFNSEIRNEHPGINKDQAISGFNRGGFGSLSFGDYLLLISLNNIQFWEGIPDENHRDWEGNLIIDKWPWYGTLQGDVRQDEWLENTMKRKPYKHILPFYHRALFGGARLNMSHKNRDIVKYWLPLFQQYGVKYITEAHDHMYVRTVPVSVEYYPPENSFLNRISYKPLSWDLINVSEEYLEQYYTVNTIKEIGNNEIIGWEYDGKYVSFDPGGMVFNGSGGWAAGRRFAGDRQAGNAGWWFTESSKGGEIILGNESYYITLIKLSDNDIAIESYHPDELEKKSSDSELSPFSKFRWDFRIGEWQMYCNDTKSWTSYVNE